MRHALIVNGEVVQIDLTAHPPEAFVQVPDFVQPGFMVVGGEFISPASPPPKTPPMERLDFWLAAAELGVTKADAIETAKKAFSDDKRALARVIAFIEEKPRYELEDPILIAMAAAEGITEDQLRALWAWHFPAA